MISLSKEHILLLHKQLIKQYGGSDGVRDVGLLESALATPFQTFGGVPVYPSIYAKASQLAYGLIKNHPFVDGNKRTGVHTMLTYLNNNGIELDYTQEELIKIGRQVADNSIDRKDLLHWLIEHEK